MGFSTKRKEGQKICPSLFTVYIQLPMRKRAVNAAKDA